MGNRNCFAISFFSGSKISNKPSPLGDGKIQEIFDIEVRENVERYLEPLVNLKGSKIRVGDYRLFVDYYKNKDLLVIRSIRHRRDAYKKK